MIRWTATLSRNHYHLSSHHCQMVNRHLQLSTHTMLMRTRQLAKVPSRERQRANRQGRLCPAKSSHHRQLSRASLRMKQKSADSMQQEQAESDENQPLQADEQVSLRTGQKSADSMQQEQAEANESQPLQVDQQASLRMQAESIENQPLRANQHSPTRYEDHAIRNAQPLNKPKVPVGVKAQLPQQLQCGGSKFHQTGSGSGSHLQELLMVGYKAERFPCWAQWDDPMTPNQVWLYNLADDSKTRHLSFWNACHPGPPFRG